MEPAAKPLTPEEAAKAHSNYEIARIPEAVIVAFNELIVEKWDNSQCSAVVIQDDIIDKIMETTDLDRNTIFLDGLLDIEPLFEKYGWEVTHDKPAYNETYKAYFIFKKKK